VYCLNVLHDAADGGDHGFKLGVLDAELFATKAGKSVVAGAAVGIGGFPLGAYPALQEQALQGWIEGAFLDGKDVVGGVLDGEGDTVAVQGRAGEGFEDEHVESAGHQVRFFWHGHEYIDCLWIERQELAEKFP